MQIWKHHNDPSLNIFTQKFTFYEGDTYSLSDSPAKQHVNLCVREVQ